MEIEHQYFKKLVDLGILEQKAAQSVNAQTGKVLLNKVCTTGFEMGLNVARYLGHVIKSMVSQLYLRKQRKTISTASVSQLLQNSKLVIPPLQNSLIGIFL